jgi:hypothetical protein
MTRKTGTMEMVRNGMRKPVSGKKFGLSRKLREGKASRRKDIGFRSLAGRSHPYLKELRFLPGGLRTEELVRTKRKKT